MTKRSIYAWLIAHHPLRFRVQFEQEMLGMFDRRTADEGAALLIIDAAVSLCRQWLFRPRSPANADFAAIAHLSGLSEVHLRALEEHAEAWRINLAWLITAVVTLINFPSPGGRFPTIFRGGQALFIAVVMLYSYWTHKKGRAGGFAHYSALSISADYRAELVRKRDNLELWAGGGSLSWPWEQGGPVFAVLLLLFFPLAIGALHWLLTKSFLPGADSVHLLIYAPAAVFLLCVWHFVRRANLRAARALQDEIDSLDRAQTSSR